MTLKDFYKNKKVLLTGDTGFKGSWLAIWLTQMGAEVYGYALAPDSDSCNYNTCKVGSMIKHTDGDIRDKEKFAAYVNKIKPDIAFHLAAQPLVMDSYNDPVYTFDVNIMGTVHFLEALRKSPNTKAAVVVTSDKCYHNNETGIAYKESDALGGKDPYSASKGAAEIVTASYIHSFFNTNDTCNIATGRAGNVIGGGDWAVNRIIPDFFRSYIKNENLEIRNPNAVRPWQHVLDPLYGYLLLGYKLYTDNSYSGSWNFGPAEKSHVKVQTLIEKLIGITGKINYKILENEKKLHEATLLRLDINKATTALNWRPAFDFDLTLKYTAEGYLAEIDKKNILDNRIKQIQQYHLLLEKNNIH
jgi:CDP-glucose 4,6-dehydratase